MVDFYEPQVGDLWFREKMLSDEDTMSYNHAWGGTIPFPKEKWVTWHDRWVVHHENKRFYRYIKEDDAFLGEAAYHLDEERQMYMADIIVYAPYRGKGYGRQALLLLCEVARRNGLHTLFDDIAIDNPSIALFLQCGFTEVLRTNSSVLVKRNLES